jgi:serine/threonine protein kinase
MENNLTTQKIGKYKIVGHIGRGGMADVYKALHPELNREVALKVLNRALVQSPEMLERFRREARAVFALRHPNIVQVFDLDVADDVYFMVMEYIEGETLRQRLTRLRRRRKRMPLHEVLYVITAVGEALHYAHEQDMIHRDIKPANIMFRDDDSVVLTDFGVAKILNVSSNITVTGSVAGTPAYMAPEQWTDDEPDRRSDIYSLGVVLYQMATGELPFDAETPGRLMFKHISEPPPLPRSVCARVPPELEQVILRAMAKAPQDRYQTTRELVDDLRDMVYQIESTAPTGAFRKLSRSVADSRTMGREPVKLSRIGSLVRRSPLLWLGAGAVVVLVAIVGLLAGGFFGSSTSLSASDASATAMAVRLATLEATLTSTPDVLMRTPVLTRTPSPPPITCVPAMTLLKDVNYSNLNWWSTINARFDKTWRLRNDGGCSWPQGTVLVHLDGEDLGLDEPFDVGSLPAGEDIELSLSLRAPDTPGAYEGRFQLQTPEGEPIGEPLTVKLEALLQPPSTPEGTEGAGEPVRITGFDLIEWSGDSANNVWRGKVRLWAQGGTGQYVWYRDTLDNPLPGDVLEFEWGFCRDFFGSVWVTSGDTQDHESLYIPYPEPCD